MITVYRIYGYLGLASLFGCLVWGFRYQPGAPIINLLFNLVLYGAFAGIHLIMTRSWFKRRVWGNSAGSPAERQIYIFVTIVTWLGLFAVHRPIGGPSLDVQTWPNWLRFLGLLGMIVSLMAFFEGATFAMLDGLLGVPGTTMTHSHGEETPLFTSGAYARVRHPMYRAMMLACVCSVVLHPDAAGLLWAALIAATFILFIPVEEQQLIDARGDAYREYQRQTPYRLFRGVW